MVTPTRQRAHALRLAHAAAQLAAGQRVWPSPDVLPLEGWLTREFERAASRPADPPSPRLLRPAEEWLLWRECTAGATGTLQLANPGALAEGLLAASRLAGQLGIDLTRLRAPADTETGLWLEVERAVRARAEALGARSLAAAWAAHGAVGDVRPVAFTGFAAPTPRLAALLAARRARGWPTQWCEPLEPLTQPEVLCAADGLEELDRIAGWCRERLHAAPEARLLVVLPGSPGRCAVLAALIRQGLEGTGGEGERGTGRVGIEGGEPLPEQPAVAHALRALELLGGQTLSLEPLLEWIRGPFWREPAAGQARLDLWLREHAPPQLDRRTLMRLLGASGLPAALSLRERLERAGAAFGTDSGSPRQWSERFQEALDALGWPGALPADSPAQQTFLRLRALLDEYGQLSAALARLPREAAVERLRELAARTAYRPADEDVAVTVTSVLADPVARYDGIWVAGLNQETLPQPPSPDPFVPLAAQIGAGWPAASAAGRLGEAHGLLAAWRAATDHLVLSAPRRAEDVVLLPSALLGPWLPGPPGRFAPLPWLPERMRRDGQLEPWRDAGMPWDGAVLPGGTRSLELQNACPFRAYAELRLGCMPLGLSEPGVPADLRGQLLHAALQRLWEELGGSDGLAALAPQALQDHIEACVEQAAAGLLAEQSAPPSAAALARERRRAVRLIGLLCALERTRAPFTVCATEQAVPLTLAGRRLEVRVDRLDRRADGALAILDYKSGRPVRADWYGERPSHPQLLAYLAAFGPSVRALATVHLTAREIGFLGIAAEDGLLPELEVLEGADATGDAWGARVAAWVALLERLAGAFAAGEAAVDPKPDACAYCHLAALCRIGEPPGEGDTEPEPAP